MPTPRPDTYSIASGEDLWAGGDGPVPQTVAFVGDSLTALSYGPLHPYTWALGIAGPLKPVANCGVASDTIANVLARIDNDYTNASPGLSGLTKLGWVMLRIGTNDYRNGASIDSGGYTNYAALLDKCLSYAQRVIVMAVPPVYDSGDSRGDGIPGANSWLQSYCAGNTRLHFVDDCAGLRSGGNWVSSIYTSDGIHFSDAGSYELGIIGGTAIADILASHDYASVLSTDAADVYPTQPQWVTNHTMSGTGGTNALGSGSVPSGWSVSAAGSGFAATSLIVAADVEDANQTPWLRVTPTALGANTGWINTKCSLSSATIDSSYPDALDMMVEIRFNGLDASKFSRLQMYTYGVSNERLAPDSYLRMNTTATITRTVVARSALRRATAGRVSHASASAELQWRSAGSFTGSMGSFDQRCLTIRG